MNFGRTQPFFNKQYSINNDHGVRLRVEDMVVVHPGTGESKEPYTAFVVCKQVEWEESPSLEIFIKADGQPRELMTEELFARLEPVKWSYEKDPGIPDITLFEG